MWEDNGVIFENIRGKEFLVYGFIFIKIFI